MRIGIVIPHIFMHRDILPTVIFSPGQLGQNLCEGLQSLGADVTLFSPGPVDTKAHNITADLRYFEDELALRGDTYIDLLKKHPLTFISLARQAQSELIAKAFEMANMDKLDVVHIYTNEEDIALHFAHLCKKPVVFTHHDPFNFFVKYKGVFPKYKHLNWISMSYSQRLAMPADTNWSGNIYHGLAEDVFRPNYHPKGDYIAYLGRIIEPKAVHLAIEAVKKYNSSFPNQKLKLKIAGKHYSSGGGKDEYWQTTIAPEIDGKQIEYMGFIASNEDKQKFLSNAKALIIPSTFEEPFGMVMIEALACGTPIIGLNSGSIPEVVKDGETGIVAQKAMRQETNAKTKKLEHVIDEPTVIGHLADAIEKIGLVDRKKCRDDYEKRFTLDRMCREHLQLYEHLLTK